MAVVNEAILEEIEARAEYARTAMGDEVVVQRYAEQAARNDVPMLVQAIRQLWGGKGPDGDLGVLVREALRERILRLPGHHEGAARKAALAPEVTTHTLTLHLAGDKTIVDIRLLVDGEVPG